MAIEMQYDTPGAGPEPSDEWLRVVAWRHLCLERAGVGHDQAVALASSADVDLHEALALVERGCPSRLLAPILA